MDFKVGDTYKIYINANQPYKIHICAIVDDIYIVYKFYGRHKQWWHYDLVHRDILEIKIERVEREGK